MKNLVMTLKKYLFVAKRMESEIALVIKKILGTQRVMKIVYFFLRLSLLEKFSISLIFVDGKYNFDEN